MKTSRPDWAPDNCPDNVVQLIEHESFLDRLKLHGLASANSKTLHAAIERLKSIFIERYNAGFKSGRRLGLVVGLLIGSAAGMLIGVGLPGL